MSSLKKDNPQWVAAYPVAVDIIRGDSFLANKSEAGELKAPLNPVTGNAYSGINRLILTTPGEKDPRWMTRNQAEEQGYVIKRGSSPKKLVFWATEKKVPIRGKNRKLLCDADGVIQTKTVRLARPEMQFYDVYHAKDLVRPNGQEMPPYEESPQIGDPITRAQNILEKSGLAIDPSVFGKEGFYHPYRATLVLPDPDMGPLKDDVRHSLAIKGLCGHTAIQQGHLQADELWHKTPLAVAIAASFVNQDLGLPNLPFGDGRPDHEVLKAWAHQIDEDPYSLFKAAADAEKIKDHLLSLDQKVSQDKAPKEPVRLSVPFSQRQEAKELGAYFHQEEKLWVSSPDNKNLAELTNRWPHDPEKHKPRENQDQKAPKRAYLDVPFEEKDRAKDLGARFDFKKKQWFVEPDKDLSPFIEWLSEQDRQTLPVLSPEEEFGAVLKKAGLVLDGPPVMDSKPHKVPAAGQKRGAPQATYCFMPGSDQPSFYMNHHTNESHSWTYSGQMLSESKKAELTEELGDKKAVIRQERVAAEQKVIDRIMDKIGRAADAGNDHPYLQSHEIKSFGLAVDADNNLLGLVVNIDQSLKDGQFVPKPQTLITITPEGQASIEPRTKTAGAALLLGQSQFTEIGKNPDAEHQILIASDFESGAVLHQFTGKPVAVTFGLENMQSVAKSLRKKLPNARLEICVNHDKTPQKPTTLEKANKIADSIGGTISVKELINMYRVVADVITPADLKEQNQGVAITPKVKGGKPQNIVVKRSELQAEYMSLQEQTFDDDGLPVLDAEGNPVMEWTPDSIIHRMEHLPKDPRKDNPLKITNDARKAGLDFHLIDPEAPDYEGSKVNVAADNILRLWEKWEADKGTQLVFCDLSTPKLAGQAKPSTPVISEDGDTPDDDPTISMDELLSQGAKFSVYDDLKRKLVDRGIPSEEIKFIHEAKTDAQKAKLFEAVNLGRVRVLIGSTAKMGAGTNVQQRLVGLHHLDAPWRPSDLEQREGRIIRQGNELFKRDPEGFEVEIIRYATEQTYDARMFQTIESKAIGIEQFRKGDTLARTIDDVSGEAANAAEMKAAATGNELVFTQVKLASELKKLEGIYNIFVRSQHQLDRRIAELEKAPEYLDKTVAGYEREIELRDRNTTDAAFFAAGGKIYGKKDRKELLYEVARIMKKVNDKPPKSYAVGEYRGFSVSVEPGTMVGSRQFALDGDEGQHYPAVLCYKPGDDFNINGFLQRLDNYLDKFEARIQETLDSKQKKANELQTAYQSRGQSFTQMELLEALKSDNREVMAELQKMRKDPAYKSAWVPKSSSQNVSNIADKHEPGRSQQVICI